MQDESAQQDRQKVQNDEQRGRVGRWQDIPDHRRREDKVGQETKMVG